MTLDDLTPGIITIEHVGVWRARVDKIRGRAYLALGDYAPILRTGQRAITEDGTRFSIRAIDLDEHTRIVTLHIEQET